ncbi:CsbD family protein [Crossiella sp. CA198]|uniref:CsbD family protein n=1 Tax=Crossiella sp. CA198 TaxID=3455607 RepID=UPI003F8D10E3
MSTEKKIDAKADQVKGKIKEATGKATDDEGMEAEGRGDQAKGDLKQGAEKAKDAVRNIVKD